MIEFLKKYKMKLIAGFLVLNGIVSFVMYKRITEKIERDCAIEHARFYTLSELPNHPDLKSLHLFDESFANLKDSNGNTFMELDEMYRNAVVNGNYRKADSILSTMIEMIISTKLVNLTGGFAQEVFDTLEIPTLKRVTDEENLAKIKYQDNEFYISNNDSDQFRRLILNYINADLEANGYPRELDTIDRYQATLEAFLTSESLKDVKTGSLFNRSEVTMVQGDFDKPKVRALNSNKIW